MENDGVKIGRSPVGERKGEFKCVRYYDTMVTKIKSVT